MRRAQLEISSKEFAEWMVFEGISPGYPERADIHAALISATIANANSTKAGKHKIEDFLLRFDDTKMERKTAQDIKAKLKPWASIHNKNKRAKR